MHRWFGKRVPASLTLEAAVVLPLYLFFFLALLSVMEMFQFSMTMDQALGRISKQIALYASADCLLEKPQAASAQQEQTAQDAANGGSAAAEKVEGVAATVLADLYVEQTLQERVPQEYRRQMGVQGDIALWRSNVLLKDDLVDLVATYEIEPRCNVFGIPKQLLVNRARTHAWTGYRIGGAAEETKEEEQMVYVTETGTVYHLSRSCTHLDLAIRAVSPDQLSSSRNKSGGCYQVCEKCGLGCASQGTYYITNEGDRYHSSLSCSGLKRTVYEIPISQVGDRRPCSRCGGR
jgi:hypothetical protein